jgi:hypothetical protein
VRDTTNLIVRLLSDRLLFHPTIVVTVLLQTQNPMAYDAAIVFEDPRTSMGSRISAWPRKTSTFRKKLFERVVHHNITRHY